MSDTTGQQQLAGGLLRLSFVVQREYGEVSRLHGLTPQQAQLLCVLLVGGPLGMAELGCSLHLEKSSMTGLVDRAERRGIVTRVRDVRDRRACQVALTELGVELANRFHDHVFQAVESLADELDSADRKQLAMAIHELLARESAARRPAAPVDAPPPPMA